MRVHILDFTRTTVNAAPGCETTAILLFCIALFIDILRHEESESDCDIERSAKEETSGSIFLCYGIRDDTASPEGRT